MSSLKNLASQPKEQKSHQIIEIPHQPPVDMTKILLQNPNGIVTWAFSITLVLGAIGGVMQIIKPSPQLLDSFSKSISEIIDAVVQLIQSLN
ncbi:MAG: hypothetical protein F6K62_08550 [Sphaerospermopsis sp. SIO1G2]|nr:hypothetical protein [Sphaerospermopsis sp. SIO1G2]